MKLAHILICHSTDPTRAIESIPHEDGAIWYVFLHSADKHMEIIVSRLMAKRDGNVFPYKTNRGIARSWNDALHLAYEAGCDAFILLNDDLFFYENGYNSFKETVEAVRNISREVSFVTVHGLETGSSAHSGQVRPQDFACCAIMKEAVERVGYFDQTFYPAYYEDVDFARRATISGMTVHIDPRTLVEHNRSSTWNAVNEEQKTSLGKFSTQNRQYFLRKWGAESYIEYVTPFANPKLSIKIPFCSRENPYSDS